jgi:MoaA/NifB/PqqE/SkfB family radical SAM enzyme
MPDVPRLRHRLGHADAQMALGLASAVFEPDRPLLVHLVVTRRCNLSCGYCHEWDHTSAPVPIEDLRERIDHLARLRTVMVVLTGGETLLHPDVVEVVSYVRERGMIPAINTNGFLLTAQKIIALGRAGLYALQVSVDAVAPNEVTKKALKPLLPKLRLLAEHAKFRVRINTVIGAAPPEEALEVVRVAMAHGFEAKCALLRHKDGPMLPLDDRTRATYREISRLGGRINALLGEGFNDDLLRDGQVKWKCRAGARFFHVCEEGMVRLCGPRFDAPATPLSRYGRDDIRRAFDQQKACAATCPVAYAHLASRADSLRPQKTKARSLPVLQ